MLYGCAVRLKNSKMQICKYAKGVPESVLLPLGEVFPLVPLPLPLGEASTPDPSPSGRGQVRAGTQHCIHPMQSAFPLLASPTGGGIVVRAVT